MARKLPKKDVVIIGLGWTGSIMANELTDAGSTWSRSSAAHGATRRPTIRRTMRRTNCATASATSCSCGPRRPPSRSATRWIRRRCRSAPGAPSCRRTASAAAACTGTRRPGASCRPISCCKTHLTQRYGAASCPTDMTIQDWGVTYDELEPHYDRFEYLCGTSGHGRQPAAARSSEGGNPFEGPRSRPYPNPPQDAALQPHAVRQGARELGYKPFPQPSGNMSQRLHQSARRAAGPVHLLRLLRVVRLRQLFQGQPADHDPAGAGAQAEFRGARQCEVTRINIDARASARPASPSSIPAARNGSSRPTS